ncbi:hypothetical protein LCL97_13690 [Seohaeicola saemankumensis]|nr:darcynin family protein [Seohaeicola saemankumensis]MCA0871886.1 hypothetical protein [Seohaeicola saemankumensis]
MKLTAFVLLQAAPEWLAMERPERDRIGQAALARAFGGPGLSLRFFDAEAFHGRVSDVAMIEADSAETWYFAIERLRDTALIAQGYFRVIDIIPAFEDGHQRFAQAEAGHAV